MAGRSTEAKVDGDVQPSNDPGRAVGRSGELAGREWLSAWSETPETFAYKNCESACVSEGHGQWRTRPRGDCEQDQPDEYDRPDGGSPRRGCSDASARDCRVGDQREDDECLEVIPPQEAAPDITPEAMELAPCHDAYLMDDGEDEALQRGPPDSARDSAKETFSHGHAWMYGRTAMSKSGTSFQRVD